MLLAGAVHRAARGVDAQVAQLQHALGDGAGRAPQQRAHARHQLGGAERLGHVVVGADLEPQQLVALAGAGGDDQDRRVAVLADAARDLQAVHAGQPQVQHHQSRLQAREVGEGVAAVGRAMALEARGLEVLHHDVRDALVVLDHQDA